MVASLIRQVPDPHEPVSWGEGTDRTDRPNPREEPVMSKPCIEKRRSMWDGSAITWCGKRVRSADRNERWLNYNSFTRSDTCSKCVANRESAR